jgi:hypothetical protein
VLYLDTASCVLKRNGYILREREDQENKQDTKKEIVLKFRSPDFLLAIRTDTARTKLEEDVTALDQGSERTHEQFRSSFGTSNEQSIDKKRQLEKLKDIYEFYPFVKDTMGNNRIKDDMELKVVSNLHIHETEYEGPTVDLGNRKAKISFTLWHIKKDQPMVLSLAELSFKHDLDRKKDDVEKSVLNNAWALLTRLQQMDWISKKQFTKTQFVYEYSDFCTDGG